MASEIEKKSSGGTTIAGIFIGTVLMVAGWWCYKNGVFAAIEKPLEAQGIPLALGKTISVMGVLLILFPVVRSFFIQPLADAINARNRELERTFSEAEELRAEMNKMKSDYEKRIVETETEAREKIQAQIREAQDLRTQLMAEASAAKEQLVAQAQEEISREKDRLLNELRIEVVNLTLGATEKVLGANVDSDANRRLVQEFIEKAEVPKA